MEAELPVLEGLAPPLAADPDPEEVSLVVLTPDGATGEPVADPTAGWKTVDSAEVICVAVLLEEVSTYPSELGRPRQSIIDFNWYLPEAIAMGKMYPTARSTVCW